MLWGADRTPQHIISVNFTLFFADYELFCIFACDKQLFINHFIINSLKNLTIMRKFYLLFVALFAGTMVASAGVKNLYKQDFEAVNSPAEAGWSSPNLAGGMSLQSTEYGKWFRFSLGNNNNRNAVLNWNPAEGTIFDGQNVKEYTVKFQWGLVKNPQSNGTAKNTQFSSEIALISPHNYQLSEEQIASGLAQKNVVNSVNNGQYAAHDSLRIFSITQLKGPWQAADAEKGIEQTPYWTDENDLSSYAFDFYIDGNTEDVITLTEDMWYDIIVTVNTETRTTKYSISELGGEVIKEGEGKIADNCDPFAKGINVLLGRYNSIADIDEVKVQTDVEGDYANAPTISLTEIDMAKRSFDIYFEEGEILHVKKTEGSEDTAVESPYKYVTETSGTLEVWTENGTATSEHVTYDVVAEPITLPLATIDITKVNAGYVKSLKMTADNSEVPMQPTITLTWEYSNGDKSAGEVANGAIYEAKEKGTLTVTTHAYGFVESTTTFENNTEFAVDATVDFQHMDEATLTAKGFTEIEELRADNMSGENNWTARSRMWFGIENGEMNDDGTPKYDTHVVYGPTTNAEAEGIRRFTFPAASMTKENAYSLFAPVYTWYSEAGDGSDVAGLKMNYGIGLINTGLKGDGSSINYPDGIIGVDGLTDNDYFIVYVISDYGSSSKHPIYPQGTSVADGKEMYKAENLGDGTNVQVKRGTETFSLYRIDTAIARIEIYKSTGETGIKDVTGVVVSDHNAPIYNLNGVQVKTLKKGIYIKQGKKFVVK
jgi:hypothetical protein